MENNEKSLTPQESLSMISEMISLAKKSIVDKGFHYLLWGWLVLLASLADYILIKLGNNYHYSRLSSEKKICGPCIRN